MENLWKTRVSVVFGLLWLTAAGALGLSGCGDAAGPVMECESGAARPCGTDQGECVAGLETCVDGEWGPCQGAVGPADEACDGLDNDCDGQTDQGCPCASVTECIDADGCCPAGCNSRTDDDCAPRCSNGVVEAGETCDPPAACPAGCWDGNPCTVDALVGNALDCNVVCSYTALINCVNADGCCPAGCNSASDNDCSTDCGNGRIDAGETCDPPESCPADCEDNNPCTADTLLGGAANCNVSCSHAPVRNCTNADGCCPAGCNNNVDADCSPTCGNGEIESGETCDPPDSCPDTCEEGNPCTVDIRLGNPANCNVTCIHLPVIACSVGDGCCPAGCNSLADGDCSPSCGNGVIEGDEPCDREALGDQSCRSLGYADGVLACTQDCNLDVGGCLTCPDLPTVRDGGFQDTTDWTTTGLAAIDTGAAGRDDPGEGRLPAEAVCALDEISQVFEMPALDTCGPARLVRFERTVPGFGAVTTSLATSLNGRWLKSPVITGDSNWKLAEDCLGELAYGGPLTLRFSGAHSTPMCPGNPSAVEQFHLDNVAIVFDPTCPRVGQASNGNLEAGTGAGWSTQVYGNASARADVAGVGVGGSVGAQAVVNETCSWATLSVPLSVPAPASMPDPALRLDFCLNAGVNATLAVGYQGSYGLTGTGAFEEARLCLPPVFAGAVQPVTVGLAVPGVCGRPVGPNVLVVDNLQVVADPDCVSTSGLIDPGFEGSLPDGGKRGWLAGTGNPATGGTPLAEFLHLPAAAQSGNGSVHLAVDQRCDSAILERAAMGAIPEPVGAAGPALAFWYRYPAPSGTILRLEARLFSVPSAVTASAVLAGTNDYVRRVVCLPPGAATRPISFQVTLTSYGVCADYLPAPEEAFLDDFELTTDPACPAL